jgi:hypothetical protein
MSTTSTWPPLSEESMLALAHALRPRGDLILSRYQRRELEQMVPREWMREASCGSSDPEAWQLGEGARPVPQVPRICGDCPARVACLATALLNGDIGVWAGTSEHQRDRARHKIAGGVPVETVVKGLLDEAIPVHEHVMSARAPKPPRPASPCGTTAAYDRGCRCDECGPVGRERMRIYRASRKAAA